VIVNTDGWIDGEEAVEYKAEMFREVQPTITLGIGDASRISQIVELGKQAALLVGSPDTVKERTRLDRRELRTLGYRKYLAGASIKIFRLDDFAFRDSVSLQPLNLDRASRSRIQSLIDSIVGLLDAEDYLQEIGIIREVNPAMRAVRILCQGTSAPVRIEVGIVKLDKDAHEIV
jgi:polynucleotide 5'-kinase involved in rRNA processing